MVEELSYGAKVLRDSVSPDGVRLITMEVTHPRFVLAELNTHRVLSRNSASSRAIPPELQVERVLTNAFVPAFNKRVKGMGVGETLVDRDAQLARQAWLEARDDAVRQAQELMGLDVDKSRVNRLLEPFMWHTAIISATEWDNFFALRDHEAAQPEFRILARKMSAVIGASEPVELGYDEWHLPGVDDDSFLSEQTEEAKRVSGRRLARVSWDKVHESEPWEDSVDKCGVLMTNGHVSPLEHVARPISQKDINDPVIGDKLTVNMNAVRSLINGYGLNPSQVWAGNFRGWFQFRKELPYEHNFAMHLASLEEAAS